MRILLAEDDELLGAGLVQGLRNMGYTVDWVQDGIAAWQALSTETLDALVLDLGMPRRDGLSVLRQLRAEGNALPVLILTARDTVDDRVAGLDLGADDYVVKPFDLAEISARLRAICRRHGGRARPLIEHGSLVIDPAARTVTLDGALVALGGHEYTLLELLLGQAGRIVSRRRIEETMYGWNEGVESNAIEVYIHHLRKKLGKDLITTVRGIGYSIAKTNPA